MFFSEKEHWLIDFRKLGENTLLPEENHNCLEVGEGRRGEGEVGNGGGGNREGLRVLIR